MKKNRIMCDCILLIMVVVAFIVLSISTLVMMFVFIKEETVADPSQLLPIRILFGSVLAGFLISVAIVSPQYLCVVTFFKESLTVWRPFRRRKVYTYKQFHNIYCGRYFHGNFFGRGRCVWYLVLSQRYLSEKELNHINNIPNSEEILKIRYSSKNCNRLRNILPNSHIKQLEIAQMTVLRANKV